MKRLTHPGEWTPASLRVGLRFLRRFRNHARRAAAAALCGALANGLNLLIPLSSAIIINRALPNRDLGLLAWIAAGLGCAAVLSLVAAYGESYLAAAFRERISLDLHRDLFEHLQRLPFSFFKTHDTGYVMSRVVNDPNTAVDFPAGLTTLGRSLVWFAAAFVLVPVIHPAIGALVMVVIPLYVGVLVLFNRRIKDRFAVVQERTAETSRELFESLSGIYETKAYRGEGYRARRYVHALAEKARSTVEGRKVMALAGHSTSIVVFVVTLVILVYGGAEVMRGRLSLGELVALNALVGYLLLPVNSLVQQVFQMQRSVAAVERLNEILELPTEPRRGGLLFQRAKGQVRFEGVSFRYGEGARVLDGVDLEIAAGETVLFVGESGQGKTSLMTLLPRFFVPCEGRIYLDGHAIDEMDLGYLRSQISYVSQETFLFSDTVHNNIRIGRQTASLGEVREAAQLANAMGFIEALPQGLETRVGERGCRLSGGQRQRIAIARALLKRAPILILDEATSAVDPGTEAAVYEALTRLMRGATTLVVAHHSDAFLGHVDRVFDLKSGKLTETRQPTLKVPREVVV